MPPASSFVEKNREDLSAQLSSCKSEQHGHLAIQTRVTVGLAKMPSSTRTWEARRMRMMHEDYAKSLLQ